jgi:hypothetical protein
VNGWDVRPTLDRANANRRPLVQAAGSFVAGSPLPQALIQCCQRLTYELRLGKLVHPVVVSTAACGRRLGGGLALDGLFTGLDRAPERTGDSPPRHIPSPTSLRAHHCVPSSVHAWPCSKGPHSPTSSGSPPSRSKMALNGIVPNCPTAHLTLCAAKCRKFGACGGGKSWERAKLEATKLSSRDPWIALLWHDARRLEQVLRADARSTPCGRALPRRAGRPA